MDIEVELDTLMDLRDDAQRYTRIGLLEKYLDQRKKIEDEFQRLQRIEERAEELEAELLKYKYDL